MLKILKEATPLLLAIVFIGLFCTAFIFLDLHEITVDDSNVPDYRWRLFWGLSLLVLYMTMLGSYVTSVKLIHTYAIDEIPDVKKIVYGFLLIVAALVAFAPFDFGGATAVQLQKIIDSKAQIDIFLITKITNTLAVVTILALIIGVSFLAIKLGRDEAEIQSISLSIHRSLYSSSLLLAAGIIEIYCLFNWAAALKPDNRIYSEASMSLIIAGGLFLTVFLLVVYVPLFMKRNERLRIHLRNLDLATKADIENWYAVNHLEKDMGASVNDIIAYTLPIATGIMVNILSASLK